MNKKVLIVDDDPRNIFALKITLKARNYQTESCTSAQEAILFVENDPEIGIVLLDMMMPEMDGYEALRIIRNMPSNNKIPVIAVTAQAMQGDRERCLEAGADDYISKPINVDQLLKAIEKLS